MLETYLNGALQFSHLYPQFVFVAKGVATAVDTTSPTETYGYTAGANIPQGFDVLALRCTQAHAGTSIEFNPALPALSNSSITTQLCQKAKGNQILGPTGLPSHSVEWWGFNLISRYSPSEHGFGIECIDEATGKLTFSTAYRSMRLGGAINWAGDTNQYLQAPAGDWAVAQISGNETSQMYQPSGSVGTPSYGLSSVVHKLDTATSRFAFNRQFNRQSETLFPIVKTVPSLHVLVDVSGL